MLKDLLLLRKTAIKDQPIITPALQMWLPIVSEQMTALLLAASLLLGATQPWRRLEHQPGHGQPRESSPGWRAALHSVQEENMSIVMDEVIPFSYC